jgi:hypothetical protein
MPRRRAKIHLLRCVPDEHNVDTTCNRRVPLHYLAVVTDIDSVTCEKCRKAWLDARRAARLRERRLRRELGEKQNNFNSR